MHAMQFILILVFCIFKACFITSLVVEKSPEYFLGLKNGTSAPNFNEIFFIVLLSVDTITLSKIFDFIADLIAQ